MVRRIAVIGISGAGKTTAARELAAATGLPLFHMDALFWRGAWEPVPEPEYLEAHARLVAQERWIIEGYVDAAMAQRLQAAERIIDLDPPGWLCAARVLRRGWTHRAKARPELPTEALERTSPAFLWRVLTRAERPAIDAALAGVDPARIERRR